MILAKAESTSALDHVLTVWEKKKGKSPIYDFLIADIALVSASHGTIIARLELSDKHVNASGSLHGAVTATLVDWSGGLAIASQGLEQTGASISIHIDYIGTAQVGDTIQIEATANKVGRSLAFTSISIKKLRDGSMVATASHTKYLPRPKETSST